MIEATVALLNILLFIIGLLVFYRIRRTIRLFHRRKRYSPSTLLKELPSVTVCIPARNERHAMTQCLENVLASNYPKLEVIVCDDSSVDGTSNLIKAFARDGVRFIEGTPPVSGWLGKNNALNALLGEASGSYVLFLDVDTILDPSSIGQMVAYTQETNAKMVSVLPLRRDMWRASVVFAPLRYFWRILFHSRTRPVAASSAWMIDRRAFIHDIGDFSSLKAEVEPEAAIAEYYAAQSAYRFLISYDLLGISYEKKLSSQIETSVRLRFPALNGSYVRTFIATLILLAVIMLPIIALCMVTPLLTAVSIPVILIYYACYAYYLRVVWHRGAAFGALLYPIILLMDVAVLLTSALKYTTNSVTWKGRPVALSTHSHLPQVED